LNGDPRLGVVGVFLLFILVVRTAANLFLIRSLASGTAIIDTSQVSCVMLSYTAFWGCLGGAMHLLRLLKVIPKNAFINNRQQGRKFRKSFRRQILLCYPINYFSFIFIVSITFLIPSGDQIYFLGRSIIVLLSMMVAFIVLEMLPDGILPETRDLQIIEVLFLLFMVVLNPDIGNVGNKVVILSQGFLLPISGNLALIATPAAVLIILVAFILLVLIKRGERKVENRLRFPVLVLWYGRVIGRIWFILYLIVLPLIYSPYIGGQLKRILSVGTMIFGVFSVLLFKGISSVEVDSLWHRSVLKVEHRYLWLPVYSISVFLGSVPGVFFLFFK
jgi:hypothetical protein